MDGGSLAVPAGARVTRLVCEKFARNILPNNFFGQNQCKTFPVGKSSQKMWAPCAISKQTAQSKQSPNGANNVVSLAEAKTTIFGPILIVPLA
jgi:hypothetical protein